MNIPDERVESDEFDPVLAALALRQNIIDGAPRLFAEVQELRKRVRELENGYGEIRDMCCRGPSYKLAERIVAYVDVAVRGE